MHFIETLLLATILIIQRFRLNFNNIQAIGNLALKNQGKSHKAMHRRELKASGVNDDSLNSIVSREI